MIKLNIGGGPKRINGFINMDALWWDGATDIIQDLTKPPYRMGKLDPESPDRPFEPDSVDEILCHEVLEHIEWKYTEQVLDEFYRILKPGGTLDIQVPDIEKMCKMLVADVICDCVPHKANKEQGFAADPYCKKCNGQAQVNPSRWLFAFVGAQKHEYDIHRNIFTPKILKNLLLNTGFTMEQKPDIYKIKIIATK